MKYIKTIIQSTIIYGAEAWEIKEKSKGKLLSTVLLEKKERLNGFLNSYEKEQLFGSREGAWKQD